MMNGWMNECIIMMRNARSYVVQSRWFVRSDMVALKRPRIDGLHAADGLASVQV